MYVLLLLLLLGAGGVLGVRGIQGGRRSLTIAGVFVVLATLVVFGLLDFWGEMLWFSELGFSARFWKVILTNWALALAGLAGGSLVVYLLTLPIPGSRRIAAVWPELAGGFVGLLLLSPMWSIVLRFLYRVEMGLADPILGRDIGFYLFALPFYERLSVLFLMWAGISVAAALAALFLHFSARDEMITFELPDMEDETVKREARALFLPCGALLFSFAWHVYLKRFELMYSRLGAVQGAGWTDVHVRLPILQILTILSLVSAVAVLVKPLREIMRRPLMKRRWPLPLSNLAVALMPPILLMVVWFLGLVAVPGLFQWLRVEPNEITMERPYIEHNITFTRSAFKLDEMNVREFPAVERFTSKTVEDSRDLLDEVRLWDWRALSDVYRQFQEIRLYYSFHDIDIDRYTFNDDYRQVMISAREMDLESLPIQSQTFVNRRFKYTHGHGLAMSPVSEFTAEGLPHMLVKDLPPQAVSPDLQVDRPEIYYGELTHDHVIVNSEEKEFDYPSGDTNVYVRYEGEGGVRLSSLWRKFLFGWKFDGTRFLLSSYPTRNSRVMFHREITERLELVAPFLTFEPDPYIVLSEGRLYWIVDAYTTSENYPYSESFSGTELVGTSRDRWGQIQSRRVAEHLTGVNYIRNSVKAVVDAYSGKVDLYVFEPDDPVVRVWARIFPDLFKPRDKMPDALQSHVRYPSSFLLVQGLVYGKYHMTDPTVFYNQEDLWVRATEKYYNSVQPVEPYYVMWEPPENGGAEFTLILPFTPKNKCSGSASIGISRFHFKRLPHAGTRCS